MNRFVLTGSICLMLAGCREQDVDARELGGPGEACEPAELGEEAACEAGLSCDPSGEAFVCAQKITLHGKVYDALTGEPLAGALVTALDEAGSPVSTAATTDAEGNYTLDVHGRRGADGEPATDARWTLFASATGYQSLPSGIRPAVPVTGSEAVAGDEGYTLESGATELGLLPLESSTETSTITGDVQAATPAGTMVMATHEDGSAVYTIADSEGHFVLFNVPRGNVTLWGCRTGIELEQVSLSVADEEHADVVLEEVTSDPAELASVTGNISIVNAPGGSQTSVVLVPAALWQPVLERGPVPLGMRAPEPPGLPSVTGQFSIAGLPSGKYKVLAAFENDSLVRDPDTSISGTDIIEIDLQPGQQLDLSEGFKVTEALTIIGPGADAPEAVEEAPTFIWADDSSETHYGVVVHDALGEEVWRNDNVAGVSGSDTVELAYGGPALVEGMTYQFRVTSYKETSQGTTSLSRSEDLRGIFVYRAQTAADE